MVEELFYLDCWEIVGYHDLGGEVGVKKIEGIILLRPLQKFLLGRKLLFLLLHKLHIQLQKALIRRKKLTRQNLQRLHKLLRLLNLLEKRQKNLLQIVHLHLRKQILVKTRHHIPNRVNLQLILQPHRNFQRQRQHFPQFMRFLLVLRVENRVPKRDKFEQRRNTLPGARFSGNPGNSADLDQGLAVELFHANFSGKGLPDER